jgi:hypothetical protein
MREITDFGQRNSPMRQVCLPVIWAQGLPAKLQPHVPLTLQQNVTRQHAHDSSRWARRIDFFAVLEPYTRRCCVPVRDSYFEAPVFFHDVFANYAEILDVNTPARGPAAVANYELDITAAP